MGSIEFNTDELRELFNGGNYKEFHIRTSRYGKSARDYVLYKLDPVYQSSLEYSLYRQLLEDSWIDLFDNAREIPLLVKLMDELSWRDKYCIYVAHESDDSMKLKELFSFAVKAERMAPGSTFNIYSSADSGMRHLGKYVFSAAKLQSALADYMLYRPEHEDKKLYDFAVDKLEHMACQ